MKNDIEVGLNISGNALKGIALWKSALKSANPVLASVQKNVASLGQAQNLTTAALKNAADGAKKTAETQKEKVKTVGQQIKDFFEELTKKSKKFRETTNIISRSAGEAFKDFTNSSGKAFDNLFSNVFTQKISSFREAWSAFTEDMKNAFLNVLAKMVSGLVQENLLKPALKIGEGVLGNIFGFAKGGLVKKPTLGVLGEAGPELVVPLKELGLRTAGRAALKTIGGRLLEGQITKAATQQALKAGIAEGIEGSAVAAGKQAFLNNIVAPVAVAAAVADFFLNRGRLTQGAIQSALGVAAAGKEVLRFAAASVLPGFRRKNITPFERGEANKAAIVGPNSLIAPLARQLSIDPKDLLAQSGGSPFIAGDILRVEMRRRGLALNAEGALAPDAGNFHSFEFAKGGLVRRPVLGLIGEAGPEHVLNVDSPASVRALREGLRPIVEGLAGASGGAAGGRAAATVNVDLRGAFFPDARSVDRLFRLLEAHGASRRLFQPARA